MGRAMHCDRIGAGSNPVVHPGGPMRTYYCNACGKVTEERAREYCAKVGHLVHDDPWYYRDIMTIAKGLDD